MIGPNVEQRDRHVLRTTYFMELGLDRSQCIRRQIIAERVEGKLGALAADAVDAHRLMVAGRPPEDCLSMAVSEFMDGDHRTCVDRWEDHGPRPEDAVCDYCTDFLEALTTFVLARTDEPPFDRMVRTIQESP